MEHEKTRGYVYILTNKSFRDDWVKIGKSSRPVDVRSKELDNTAVPLPFDIYATMQTEKYNEIERIIHKTACLLRLYCKSKDCIRKRIGTAKESLSVFLFVSRSRCKLHRRTESFRLHRRKENECPGYFYSISDARYQSMGSAGSGPS